MSPRPKIRVNSPEGEDAGGGVRMGGALIGGGGKTGVGTGACDSGD